MTTKSPLLEWVSTHVSTVTVAHDLINPVSVVDSYGKDERSIVVQREFQAGAKLHEVKKSDFYGYIQQLPTTISLPFIWDEKFRDMIRHTTASPILDDKLVLKMYSDYAVPLAKKFSTIWPHNVSTLEKFQWAYSIVASRAFKATDMLEPTILPVIDMANHEADNPVAHIVRTDSGSYQLIALRKVEKGESVTISYGDMSNAQLLCRYGFVLPTLMPSDSIHITSSELINVFEACPWYRDEKDEQVEEHSLSCVGKGKGTIKTKNLAKRRKLAHPESDDNAVFFCLNGNAEQEFGQSEALLSFVMASKLPAERLYDVLAVILQEKDKCLKSPPTPQVRQICRCVLLGLMSLEESSDSSDDEDKV
ncbi:unnamed protein product [Peronospora destructor]|uniref:SET domain-containing protein n=1 Tax=Peronospora destructor TaxID=86335 RepID=A0AAV0VDM7_9STRA|nr:unnamed protein product [Peronospora destructor]